MKNERPRIQIPFKTLDIVIELASIAILILMWLHLIIEYPSLPETIASHFNGSGKADGYSNKLFVWFLPALATIIYAGLLLVNRYPHLHNYMVNITEENAFKYYTFSTRVLRIVNFLCTLMFGYISYKIIEGAKNNASSLGMSFMIIIIGVSLALPVFIYAYQKKLKS